MSSNPCGVLYLHVQAISSLIADGLQDAVKERL